MKYLLFLICLSVSTILQAQSLDDQIPVRGFSIGAPNRKGLDDFLDFMENELATNYFNTLILRIDYNYAYTTYPELRNDDPLTKSEVKKIVDMARKHSIEIVPQINLLGHQSWAGGTGKLLTEYPQFDETPWVEMPEDYKWPNADSLYCKSYCPLHPDVHEVVFGLMDELMEVYEAKSFHAGMDEVFYIGDDRCPRCQGMDKSKLFADEVNRIRDHLAEKDQRLWIWGDRLLEGNISGLGIWEASANGTYRAIDMIAKDVVICDWHYEKAEPTPPLFAVKGLDVVACPWRIPEVATGQLKQLQLNRQLANDSIASRFRGIVHTIWTGSPEFFNRFYDQNAPEQGDVQTFKTIAAYFHEVANKK